MLFGSGLFHVGELLVTGASWDGPTSLRKAAKDWRTGQATKKLGEALHDAYIAILGLAMVGAMIVNVIISAQQVVAQCASDSCLSARAVLPWGSLALSVVRCPGRRPDRVRERSMIIGTRRRTWLSDGERWRGTDRRRRRSADDDPPDHESRRTKTVAIDVLAPWACFDRVRVSVVAVSVLLTGKRIGGQR